MAGKLIIFSAPSGSGKSTIINYLLTQNLNLAFSISATSRAPRGTEQNGVEYFFLTPEEFKQRIANDEFLEYEEVYKDRFYGTLKAQVEKQLAAGQNVIFDVDVVGGCNIKKFYGDRALSVFIQPPSLEELRKRLTGRGTARGTTGISSSRAAVTSGLSAFTAEETITASAPRMFFLSCPSEMRAPNDCRRSVTGDAAISEPLTT
jgi:guanylate kinase